MRKPAFCIFLWPSYSHIIFYIDHFCAGVSNKHCLLPFSLLKVQIGPLRIYLLGRSLLVLSESIVLFWNFV